MYAARRADTRFCNAIAKGFKYKLAIALHMPRKAELLILGEIREPMTIASFIGHNVIT